MKNHLKKILGSKKLINLLLKQHNEDHRNIYFVSVNPKKITGMSLVPENSPAISGSEAVYGAFTGYFDRFQRSFDNYFMYQTVQQLMNGIEGDQTIYFKKSMKKYGEHTARMQLKKLIRHIHILLRDGYRSQYELGKLDQQVQIADWSVPVHEIQIGMDRNGNLFRLKGGRHRLAIAQNMDIDEIPAVLTLFHETGMFNLPKRRRIITGDPEDFRPF
jgi:hypothetical protein